MCFFTQRNLHIKTNKTIVFKKFVNESGEPNSPEKLSAAKVIFEPNWKKRINLVFLGKYLIAEFSRIQNCY